MKKLNFLIYGLAFLFIIPRLAAQYTPNGTEFMVNQTPGGASNPSVIMNDNGDIYFTWYRIDHINQQNIQSIFQRSYYHELEDFGPELQVNKLSSYTHTTDIIGNFPDNYLISWSGRDPVMDLQKCFIAKYRPDNLPIYEEKLLNSDIAMSDAARIAMNQKGEIAAVWSYMADYYDYHLIIRLYDTDGNPVSDTMIIHTGGYESYQPGIAYNINGEFMVTWTLCTRTDNVKKYKICAQRFNPSGNKIGEVINVTNFTEDWLGSSTICSDNRSNYIVVWNHLDDITRLGSIYVRRFNKSGKALEQAGKVNNYEAHTTLGLYGSISSDANGNYVIAWTSNKNNYFGVSARRYKRNGIPFGKEILVSEKKISYHPDVAMDNTGQFVVAWIYSPSDGIKNIYAKKYSFRNIPPSSKDFTKETDTDQFVRFDKSDFYFYDPDNYDNFRYLKILDLPRNGILFCDYNQNQSPNDGEIIDKETKIGGRRINTLSYIFTGNIAENKCDSFQFKVSDGNMYCESTYRALIDIRVNTKIALYLKGSEALGIPAHFNLYVNGKLIGDAYTTANYQPYEYDLALPVNAIEEVMLQYDNDECTVDEDRNIYVDWIKIGNTKYFPDERNVIYEIETTDGINTQPGQKLMPWNGALIFHISADIDIIQSDVMSWMNVYTYKNTALKILLKNIDFKILKDPIYGYVQLNPPNILYMPDHNYTGSDIITIQNTISLSNTNLHIEVLDPDHYSIIGADIKGSNATGQYTGTDEFAFFTVSADGKKLGGLFSSSDMNTYQFLDNKNEQEVKTVVIKFTNDEYFAGQDRNLYVESLQVGCKKYYPDQHAVYDVLDRWQKGTGRLYAGTSLMPWNGSLIFDLSNLKGTGMNRSVVPYESGPDMPHALSVYPNPFMNKIYIQVQKDLDYVVAEIHNLTGSLIVRRDYTFVESGGIIELNLEEFGLSEGMYYLHLYADSGINQIIKLIKNH